MDWSFETAVRTLWAEARGEPDEGVQAVALVIVNRLHKQAWGSTLASVCLAPYQFSCWNSGGESQRREIADLVDTDPSLERLRAIMQTAVDGLLKDFTGGATYYYAPRLVSLPPWVSGRIYCGKFGSQEFYR